MTGSSLVLFSQLFPECDCVGTQRVQLQQLIETKERLVLRSNAASTFTFRTWNS